MRQRNKDRDAWRASWTPEGSNRAEARRAHKRAWTERHFHPVVYKHDSNGKIVKVVM